MTVTWTRLVTVHVESILSWILFPTRVGTRSCVWLPACLDLLCAARRGFCPLRSKQTDSVYIYMYRAERRCWTAPWAQSIDHNGHDRLQQLCLGSDIISVILTSGTRAAPGWLGRNMIWTWFWKLYSLSLSEWLRIDPCKSQTCRDRCFLVSLNSIWAQRRLSVSRSWAAGFGHDLGWLVVDLDKIWVTLIWHVELKCDSDITFVI